MPSSPVVITPPPFTTTSTSPENISSRSTATLSHSPSSGQDQNSATPTLSSPQPLVSRFRPLAPAPLQGTTPMAPPLRLSSSSTAQIFSPSSTTGSSGSGTANVTASSPRGQTIASDPADEEDWEDLPSAAIREMDQTNAQHQLFRANAAIRRLRSSLSVARTASTRYRFDSRMLRFETEESLKRYQVENFIIKRQVDILRVNLLRARPSDQKPSESEMAARIEADKYRWRLIRAKSRLFETQKMLEGKEMEIYRLRQRLGEGRLQRDGRVQGGSSLAGVARDGQNHNSKQRAGSNDDEGALAALGILASQVLSQQQMESSDEQTSCQETSERRTAHPEKEVGAISSASAIPTAQRVVAQESVTTQAAESDTDVSATDVEHTDTELDDQFEDAEEALAPTTSHSRMKNAESKADISNDNKATTEQIVDNGEDLNTLERASRWFRKSENTDNFDPDETIEVPSSPVALATFRSINERRSPRKLNLETQESESPLTPRKTLKHRRRRSSASTVSESESVFHDDQDMLISPSGRLKQKQSANPKKLRV
ncbi:hypothetical protein V1506DRAFT_505280 [Lipomyces tetrasporus]